jgi:Protein of unknown function (DUF3187)
MTTSSRKVTNSFGLALYAGIALLTIAGRTLAQEADARETLLAPLPVRDQFLLNSGFFFFEPESAKVLGKNVWSIDLHETEANTIAESNWISRRLAGNTMRVGAGEALAYVGYDGEPSSLFLVHGQTHRATLSIHRSIGSHIELGLAIPISRIGGGWSDQIIEDFHHVFGLGDKERKSLRQNHEAVYVHSPAATYLRDRSAGVEVGDIVLTSKTGLPWLEGKNVALAIDGAIKLPTGNTRTLVGSGSVDGGIQMLASRDFGRSRITASLGLLFLGPDPQLGTRFQFLKTSTEGVSYLLTDHTGVMIQLSVSESPLRNLGIPELNRLSYQLTSGIKHEIGAITLYAGLIHNMLNLRNSADVGMICGISKSF